MPLVSSPRQPSEHPSVWLASQPGGNGKNDPNRGRAGPRRRKPRAILAAVPCFRKETTLQSGFMKVVCSGVDRRGFGWARSTHSPPQDVVSTQEISP